MIKRFVAILLCLLMPSAAWATFPTVSASAGGDSAAGTSHGLTLPTCSSGKTLIAYIGTSDGTGTVTINSFTGWTGLVNSTQSEATLGVLYKKSTGSDTLTVQISESAELSYTVDCVDGATDPTVTAPQVSSITTATTEFPNPASLTPTGGAKDYLWIVAAALGNAGRTIDSYPTNYINGRQEAGPNGGNSGNIAIAYRSVNAASEDPGTYDLDAGTHQSVTVTVAIHPAAASLTPTGPIFFQ